MLPPVRASFDDLVEFCFSYAIVATRLDEHLPSDTTVAERLSHSFCQFLTFARSTLVDCDDGHDNLLSFAQKASSELSNTAEVFVLSPILPGPSMQKEL